MKRAAIYDENGDVICFVTGNDDNIAANTQGKNYILVPEDADLSAGFWRVVDGQLQTSVTNEVEIEVLRQRKWEVMKQSRDAEEFGGMVFAGNTYDTDALSQQRIQGAAQLASLDAITEMDWTTAENTTVTLTKADVINLGLALGSHITTAHSRGRIVRQQIEAATTKAELEAITWPTS